MSYKFLEKFEKIFNKMKKSSKKEIDSTLDEAKNHMKSWEDILEKYKSTQEKKKTTNYQQLNYNIDVEPVEIIRRGYFEVGSTDNCIYDESIFNFYKLAYDNAISSKKSALHLNTIQNRLITLYNRMIPDEIKRSNQDRFYRFVESLKPYKDSLGNTPNAYSFTKKNATLKNTRVFKNFFCIDNYKIQHTIEEDLSEYYLKEKSYNNELQKQTETYEKPAYEQAIEEFYEL